MTKQICVARVMQGWKTHVNKSWLGLFSSQKMTGVKKAVRHSGKW